MKLDENKIDDTALALLFLTLHDERRVWKGIDFDVLDRLYEKGFIDNPVSKAKSVWLTDEELSRSRELCEKIFSR